MPVPVVRAGRVPSNQQLAGRAGGDRRALLVDDLRVVAGNQLPARASARLSQPIRDEDVQHFSRSDAIEDLDAESLSKPSVHNRRQRFAGRDRRANARQIEVAALAMVREHHREMCRHGVEQRRPITLNQIVDDGRSDGTRPENTGGADGEREIHRVAEPVRKEQFRDAEAPILPVDPQHATRVVVGADEHVVLEVDTTLRRARYCLTSTARTPAHQQTSTLVRAHASRFQRARQS